MMSHSAENSFCGLSIPGTVGVETQLHRGAGSFGRGDDASDIDGRSDDADLQFYGPNSSRNTFLDLRMDGTRVCGGYQGIDGHRAWRACTEVLSERNFCGTCEQIDQGRMYGKASQ